MSFAVSDVHPGDVLLFHGKGWISWAIRKFDGTEVNHAAVALDGGKLGEAVGAGLRRNPIADSVAANDFTVVRRLDGAPDIGPVVARASFYLDRPIPYAYQQLVLLALLASTRKIRLPALVRRLLRSALDHAAAALNAIVDSGSDMMICSEYVYRCYDEAFDGQPDPYMLDILAAAAAFAGGGSPGGDEGSYLDWALSQPSEMIPATPPGAFAAVVPTGDLDTYITQAEEELAPLIQEYGEAAYPDDPEVQGWSAMGFAAPAPTLPEPTDEELLGSMASFSAALDQWKPPDDTGAFAGVGGLGGLVIHGALQGLAKVSADPNFVTPGDLLKTPSLQTVGRVPE